MDSKSQKSDSYSVYTTDTSYQPATVEQKTGNRRLFWQIGVVVLLIFLVLIVGTSIVYFASQSKTDKKDINILVTQNKQGGGDYSEEDKMYVKNERIYEEQLRLEEVAQASRQYDEGSRPNQQNSGCQWTGWSSCESSDNNGECVQQQFCFSKDIKPRNGPNGNVRSRQCTLDEWSSWTECSRENTHQCQRKRERYVPSGCLKDSLSEESQRCHDALCRQTPSPPVQQPVQRLPNITNNYGATSRQAQNRMLRASDCDQNMQVETDCSRFYGRGERSNGVRCIQPYHDYIKVVCDLTKGERGWTVILQKNSRSTKFVGGDWNQMRVGFGFPKNRYDSYYLGNEYVHQMTRSGTWKLRIELIMEDNEKLVGEYRSFKLGPESDGYRLHVEDFDDGNLTDILNCGYRFDQKFFKKITGFELPKEIWKFNAGDILRRSGVPDQQLRLYGVDEILKELVHTEVKAEIVLGPNGQKFSTENRNSVDRCGFAGAAFWFRGQLKLDLAVRLCYQIPFVMGGRKQCPLAKSLLLDIPQIKFCSHLKNLFSSQLSTFSKCSLKNPQPILKAQLLGWHPGTNFLSGFMERRVKSVRWMIQRR